ncbi:MAG: alpha-hydroxy-acid oxidizing protein, partial [Nitrospinae bacterium]|nr:alpha-hydroxy-acid oxidizing protein [Nitrospinota bacterium]
GKEIVGSLGHGGPLAALSPTFQNVAEYFKENVAVVTNPAVDREREKEHFSTRVILGSRPDLFASQVDTKIEIKVPFVLHMEKNDLMDDAALNNIALNTRCICWTSLISQKNLFHGYKIIDTVFREKENLEKKLKSIAQEAIQAVRNGKELIILDDAKGTENGYYPIDPVLVTAYVDNELQNTKRRGTNISKRRSVSIVVKSKAIRNLHDIIVVLGFGANAVSPTLLLETALENATTKEDAEKRLQTLINGLSIGIEKVISTMGTYELRGYGRYFSPIGLSTPLAEMFGVANYCGGKNKGLTIPKIEAGIRNRKSGLKGKISLESQINSRIWKKIGDASTGKVSFNEVENSIRELEEKSPLSIRHCFTIKPATKKHIDWQDVDISVENEKLPFLISAMSYGSTSEEAFTAYLKAANGLNMIALNGEGGEPKHLVGKYYHCRSQQLASGRFGINIDLLNSSKYIEIKIGQGAKPGEGGMLPAGKVTKKIAAARHTTTGITLISPSNNHDIYSIEDLAQVVSELKTANHDAKVIVKVPIVKGIGTIALAIAKAGADVINVSGFDGGTGAARLHAIKYVGLPAEVGVYHAHRVLSAEGLRNKVEIWCDGGMRRAEDVLKMIAMGANRVGFGTLPMMALGCTSCRGCHLNTCHVGIATQITTAEAAKKAGIKNFRPLVEKQGIENLTRLFSEMGDELKRLCAERGIKKLQDIVGRADLIQQFAKMEELDIVGNIKTVREKEKSIRRQIETKAVKLRRPQNQLTRDITELFEPHLLAGKTNIVFEENKCYSSDREIVTDLAGFINREQHRGKVSKNLTCTLYFKGGVVGGGGFASYHSEGINTIIEGASQDGACKSANGGDVYVLKGLNSYGFRIGGSVGKCFAYGAQKGFFVVQGDADSRACIRMSGADIVFSAPMKRLVNPLGHGLDYANLKGFAFEYMTGGRVIVLGDPGQWICGGMTGGAIYVMLHPAMGLFREEIAGRISGSSIVTVQDLKGKDESNIYELLTKYRDVAKRFNQNEEVKRIDEILSLSLANNFVKLAP